MSVILWVSLSTGFGIGVPQPVNAEVQFQGEGRDQHQSLPTHPTLGFDVPSGVGVSSTVATAAAALYGTAPAKVPVDAPRIVVSFVAVLLFSIPFGLPASAMFVTGFLFIAAGFASHNLPPFAPLARLCRKLLPLSFESDLSCAWLCKRIQE